MKTFLFLLTIFTTTVMGAFLSGADVIKDPSLIIKGLPFSVSLILILGSHELGHYFLSKKHGVSATLPYFIPAPTILGTFGAVIKLKSQVKDRISLCDIGAAGPLIGFLFAVPVYVLGLKLSTLMPIENFSNGYFLGNSLITSFLTDFFVHDIPDGYTLVYNPVAFAGWAGFLITSFNLIPVGQLDGGHIAFAALGKTQEKFSRIIFFILVIMGIIFSQVWLVWAVLLFFLGIKHPPTYDLTTPLDRKRKIISLFCLVVFILTFTPVPMKIVQ
ncbi:MAG: site-2 protease family protein [Deltaproteobacteria bacterium]|nr:site-2 protease family protein [Deltaproteobacteria bacterium]